MARVDEPNTRSGFARIGELLATHHVTRVGIEGSGHYGRCVAAYLALDWDQSRVTILEVPTLMTSRERGARDQPDRHPRGRADHRRPVPSRSRRHQPLPEPERVRLSQRHRTPVRLVGADPPAPVQPRRQPAFEQVPLHDRDHPDPRRHRRPGLLPTQTRSRQDQQRSPPLPQTTPLRHRLLSHETRRRRGGRGQRNPGTTNSQPASSVTEITARQPRSSAPATSHAHQEQG